MKARSILGLIVSWAITFPSVFTQSLAVESGSLGCLVQNVAIDTKFLNYES
ncbi:MAG: hypothetical protein HC941_17975 [Microcoleus sp. SU_5_3]|nr:hypothetical protein [Microcoleus sp. SU_5_3]